jgi:pimeloyl-ACP methyl ester carboxylesterase
MITFNCFAAVVAASLTLQGGTAAATPAACSAAGAFSPSSAPVLADSAGDEKVKYETVDFKTRDKQPISARLYTPRKKGRAPAVLLVHAAGSDAAPLNELAINLQRKGFAVLIPNLRGHGPSVSKDYNWAKNTEQDLRTKNWAFAIRDLEASTDFIRDHKGIHNSNLTVVGVGAGALLATRYAVQDENARAIVLVAPDSENFGFNMLSDLNELGGLPVLIMSESKQRKDNVRIANASAKANDGIEFIEVKSLKPKKDGDLFSDKRLNSEITKFLEKQAMPKR